MGDDAPDWLNEAIAIHFVPDSFADLDVVEYVSSIRKQSPEFAFAKGAAGGAPYLGGVWLYKRESFDEPGVLISALIFYSEVFYKQLTLARAMNRSILFGVDEFAYRLDGDRIMRLSMAAPWPGDELGGGGDAGASKPEEPEEEEAIRWKYENGCLNIEDPGWFRHRPSDIAEVIAAGLAAKTVKYVHMLALLSDPDFKERVDTLPLRSTHTHEDPVDAS